MDTSCVKQSYTLKYVIRVLGGAVSKNTDNSTNYYDIPKYVVHVFGGAMSKTYRRLPQSRNHRHVITTF